MDMTSSTASLPSYNSATKSEKDKYEKEQREKEDREKELREQNKQVNKRRNDEY
jgi:hypothetical protein